MLISPVYRIPTLADDYYVALATVVAAMIPIFLGIRQYAKGQVVQRQQLLFGLIKELNESEELILAKKLIAYKKVPKPNAGWFSYPDPEYYSINQLEFLTNPEKGLDNQGELAIKESLDSFIVFFGIVGYSLKVNAIARNEIIYFQYWIDQIINNPLVLGYINLPGNEFPLFQLLVKELTKHGILSKWRKLNEPATPEQLKQLSAG